MSNHGSTDRPANQPPASSTDRSTAAYPTADHLARLEAHRDRLADLWADATPTDELPVVDRLAPFVRTKGRARRHPQPAPFVRTNGPQNEGPIQDMWRPRWLPAWHPSLMQLAIGVALVAALLGSCNVAAIQAHRAARAHCHALVVSDWSRAQRECRGTGTGDPVPEQLPSSPHTLPAPAQQTPASPVWTVHGTDSPYSKDDPSASPLDLPRCTAAPDTPMPCLAHVSPDSHHAVVLEEDASLTGMDRR